jgi:hypothetical protein
MSETNGIRCGNRAVHSETTYHPTTESVRACFAGQTGACDWFVLGYYDDGTTYERPCGAFSWTTGRGWECAKGHEHVYAEVRAAEGWDYDEDGVNVSRRPVVMDAGDGGPLGESMYAMSL